jgi:hypothetical protein
LLEQLPPTRLATCSTACRWTMLLSDRRCAERQQALLADGPAMLPNTRVPVPPQTAGRLMTERFARVWPI